MQTRTFVKLIKLVDIAYEGETAEQRERWQRNVINSVGADAYTVDDTDEGYVTAEFTTDDIEFADAECYNFMGSAYEEERFYAADWVVVKERATGDLYAYMTEAIYEGAF
jgi:hypothetical protein